MEAALPPPLLISRIRLKRTMRPLSAFLLRHHLLRRFNRTSLSSLPILLSTATTTQEEEEEEEVVVVESENHTMITITRITIVPSVVRRWSPVATTSLEEMVLLIQKFTTSTSTLGVRIHPPHPPPLLLTTEVNKEFVRMDNSDNNNIAIRGHRPRRWTITIITIPGVPTTTIGLLTAAAAVVALMEIVALYPIIPLPEILQQVPPISPSLLSTLSIPHQSFLYSG